MGSIPGLETVILHAAERGQKKNKHNKVQYWFIACKKYTHTNIIRNLGAELCVYICICTHMYTHTLYHL